MLLCLQGFLFPSGLLMLVSVIYLQTETLSAGHFDRGRGLQSGGLGEARSTPPLRGPGEGYPGAAGCR